MKLTIPGEFWDSQIYSGELLLLEDNGAINKIDWRQAVNAIADKSNDIQTAVRVAFSDSDLFYNPKVRKILLDPQIATPIKAQLSKLASTALSSNFRDWAGFWQKERSPFNFLPIDTEIYYNQFFACGDEGLYSTPRGSASSKGPKSSGIKHHDARIFQVKASDRYTAIAAAAGDDGLFEFSFNRKETDDVLSSETRLSKQPCNACEWAFQSVMGWTAKGAFLAKFKEEKEKNTSKTVRTFDRVVSVGDYFNVTSSQAPSSDGFSWGAREKIYRITENGIEVADYQHSTPKKSPNAQIKLIDDETFDRRGTINTKIGANQVVATGTAPFGAIIELNDRIIVIRSDNEVDEFLGEPVHWRVFPRSEHYSNQLHIIYEDRLEVISFVHDYFVNQKSKLAGFARGTTDELTEAF
ncbi:hypothetical protein [Cupriavidus malaysiensis]|uniref:hypothetical protein n=1 Tax=Cupriavidus malaysiensis TaxID=367825 RepID=UPI0012FF6A1F|nr:hypothetical protein [Cupriavidus malaysiensis]